MLEPLRSFRVESRHRRECCAAGGQLHAQRTSNYSEGERRRRKTQCATRFVGSSIPRMMTSWAAALLTVPRVGASTVASREVGIPLVRVNSPSNHYEQTSQ